MLILKYHLTEDEYFDFNYYTGWAAPEKKGYRIKYTLRFVFYYLAIATLYLVAVGDRGSLSGLLIFGIPGLAFFFLIPWLVRRGIRQRIRATLTQPENKHVLSAAEVILMDTGIIDKDEASETKYTWEAITRKAETPSSLYLYTNTYHAIVIPKRVLINNEDRKELQRLLNQHLSLEAEFRG
jgi:hypothetical protein